MLGAELIALTDIRQTGLHVLKARGVLRVSNLDGVNVHSGLRVGKYLHRFCGTPRLEPSQRAEFQLRLGILRGRLLGCSGALSRL